MTGLLLLALFAQNVAQNNVQNFEQRGFIENRALFYPRDAPNDRAQAVQSEGFVGGIVRAVHAVP